MKTDPVTVSEKVTLTDYDHIIAQEFGITVKLFEKLRSLNILKEPHKINENDHNNVDNNENLLTRTIHDEPNHENDGNSKATS